MRQLTLPTGISPLDKLFTERAKLQAGSFARNTQKAYAHDWKVFLAWCEQTKRNPLPATSETVSLYLTHVLDMGRKVSTAVRRTSGITHMHRRENYPTPVDIEIWRLLSGAKRLRCEQPRQMKPLTVAQLRAISAELARDGSKEAMRDRAILVIGFASALRRASLAELLTTDVTIVDEGLVVRLRREKQDQEGRGRLIGLPHGKNANTCPVRCLQHWLEQRGGNWEGPLFTRLDGKDRKQPLAGVTIGRRVKLCVERIGLDPREYGGHSLRAGFITEAGLAGAGEFVIAQHTGHVSMEILRRYFRRTDLFRSNASAMIGL